MTSPTPKKSKKRTAKNHLHAGWSQFIRVPYFISTVKGLSRTEKTLLAAILHKALASSSGSPRIRQGELAALCGFHRQKISAPLAGLESKGLIAKENVKTATRFSFPRHPVAALADYERYMPVSASEALSALAVLAPDASLSDDDSDVIREGWPEAIEDRPTSLRAAAELALSLVGRARSIDPSTVGAVPPAQPKPTRPKPSAKPSAPTAQPAQAPAVKESSSTSSTSSPSTLTAPSPASTCTVILASDDPAYGYVERPGESGRYDRTRLTPPQLAAARTPVPMVSMADDQDEDEIDFSRPPYYWVPDGEIPAPTPTPTPEAPPAGESPDLSAKVAKSKTRSLGSVRKLIESGQITIYRHPDYPGALCLVAEDDLPDAEPRWAGLYHSTSLRGGWTPQPLSGVVSSTVIQPYGLHAFRVTPQPQ